MGHLTSHSLRQEQRGQGTTIKRTAQPLRTGSHKNWLEPTRPKMSADLTSSRPSPGEGNGNPLQYSWPGKSHGRRSLVGCSPWGLQESDMTQRLYFHFYALEKEMATHSNVLAWRIPGTGEPGGLPSMGSHRVGYD